LLAAAATFFSWEHSLDGERPSVDLLAIEGVKGGFCLLTAVHLGGAEAFRASRVPVHDDHRAAVEELLRVAREVRNFPLLTLDRKPSPHVEPIRTQVAGRGGGGRNRRRPLRVRKERTRTLGIGAFEQA
jgi:hypothetical protein